MYTDDPERTRVQRNAGLRLDSSGSLPESRPRLQCLRLVATTALIGSNALAVSRTGPDPSAELHHVPDCSSRTNHLGACRHVVGVPPDAPGIQRSRRSLFPCAGKTHQLKNLTGNRFRWRDRIRTKWLLTRNGPLPGCASVFWPAGQPDEMPGRREFRQ
jgi:hypothetical protein